MVDDIISAKRSEMRERMNEIYGYRPLGMNELAGDMIRVDCGIDRRYAFLNLPEFITRNTNKSIISLIITLSALERYGYELLKNESIRRVDWREIDFELGYYKEKIAGTEGAEEILKMFGYVNKDNDRLSFSEYVKEPIREAVINILIDVIVAKEELNFYDLKSHPQPKVLGSIIEAREEHKCRSTRDISMSSTSITSSKSFRIQPINSPREQQSTFCRSYSCESWNLPPCNLCGDIKGLIECKDCACSHCVECDKEWHLHPKRKNHSNRITRREWRDSNEEHIRPSAAPGANRAQRSVSLRKTYRVSGADYGTAQSGCTLVPLTHANGSEVKRPISDTHGMVGSRQTHKVPKIDTSVVDVDRTLSNDMEDVEMRLGTIEIILQSTDRASLRYVDLVAERDNLRQQWKQTESRLGDVTVTQQPRATLVRGNHNGVTVYARTDIVDDHPLNFSDIAKNIRRPPADNVSPYEGRVHRHCEHQNEGDSKNDMSTKGKEPEQNDYIEIRDKHKPLEMIESHFSEDTPAPIGWECPHCTFINKNHDAVICEMCSKTTLKQGRETVM